MTPALEETNGDAALFLAVVENHPASILVTDAGNRIVYANPALLRASGYALEELVGQKPSILSSGETPAAVFDELWRAINAGETWQGEFINRRKDGTRYVERQTEIKAVRDAQGAVRYHLAIGDSAAHRACPVQPIEKPPLDPETGLPDRAAFVDIAVAALDNARQLNAKLAVLHIDIDDYHVVSDVYGSREAAKLLVETVRRIRESMRQDDELSRLGHDKFGILFSLKEESGEEQLFEVAERILDTLRKPYQSADKTLHITASIGIACYPDDGDQAADLLDRAFSASMGAKRDGGDRYNRFDQATSNTICSQRELFNDLRHAIDHNELRLHYQPQVSLRSGEIVGVEALIRWQHPERGQIPPAQFIPQIEQNNLAVLVGEWVMREACRQMREWLDAGLPPLKVSINLAARHFLAPNLPAAIEKALAAHDIAARDLELEITESAMMQNVSAAIRNTSRLKAIGVRIALDDFGTGYSSLAYLSRFPIDAVKLDQAFVRDITTNPINAAIAQATIAMSHKLGKYVIAEGIESEEQMRFLRHHECDEMQGYYFARPMPAEQLVRLRTEQPRLAFRESQAPAPGNTVLFVDDETNVLSSIRRALRREGYEILTANSATEAFSILARTTVQVIVSDQRMPEMNGTELLSRVKSLYPETIRMVLSGYSEISAVTDAINKGAVYRFMLKPWDDEKLKQEVSGALRHWRELYAGQDKADSTLPPSSPAPPG